MHKLAIFPLLLTYPALQTAQADTSKNNQNSTSSAGTNQTNIGYPHHPHSSKKLKQHHPVTDQEALQLILDLGWNSKYVSQGQNNLEKGGIYWSTATLTQNALNVYITLGRGDQLNYIEWNFGLEYDFTIVEHFEVGIGYQRDEYRGNETGYDNEWLAHITYSRYPWIMPSITYDYSTQASGYFLEFSLHSDWAINDTLHLTPYIIQGYDVHYVTQQTKGINHIEFGLETQYTLFNGFVISGQLSHSIGGKNIKSGIKNGEVSHGKNQTYAGIHFNWLVNL